MSFPESVSLSMKEVRTTRDAPICPLGTRGYTRDGRIFRYARCSSTAISDPCCLLKSADQVTYALSSSGSQDLLAGTTFTSTWSYINVGISGYTTALAANHFAEGFLWFGSCCSTYGSADTARGQMVQIDSHIATTASSTEFLQFNLKEEDRLVGDVTSSNACGIVHHPYDQVTVIAAAAAVAGMPAIGVNLVPVTASYYFWAQTWGYCPLKLATATTLSAGCAVAATTEAASTGVTCSTDIVVGMRYSGIGTVVVAEGAGQYGLINLEISP
jgi:hypothetical protein